MSNIAFCANKGGTEKSAEERLGASASVCGLAYAAALQTTRRCPIDC
ncbi:MAG: hypothetical protein N838_19770 [Thiohalocapsa sp. PB-PSB1]|jgi:putative hemolysin|nr:MAG: hypothetical protein N838_19770 [Thiohalocapsa sp. PB-PSB1]